MDAFVLLGSFAVLLAIGVPVAYSLGIATVIGALWLDFPLMAVMIQIGSGVNKFSLLAIPFFVLAGAIMAEGGIANRLVNFAAVFVGFIRGGLSLVNILASTFFGAISGSSVADTASIGSVLDAQAFERNDSVPRDTNAVPKRAVRDGRRCDRRRRRIEECPFESHRGSGKCDVSVETLQTRQSRIPRRRFCL